MGTYLFTSRSTPQGGRVEALAIEPRRVAVLRIVDSHLGVQRIDPRLILQGPEGGKVPPGSGRDEIPH